MTLPWWDWSKDAAIPRAYSSAQAEGAENVLAKAPIKAFNTTHKAGWPTETSRVPGEVPQTPGPPCQQEWVYAMKATTYSDFSQRIWTVHDTLHVWVGGTMGQVNWAACDPLFFAQHANVDRAWRIWQAAHPGATPPANIPGEALQTDPAMKVQQTLDVHLLSARPARMHGDQPRGPGWNADQVGPRIQGQANPCGSPARDAESPSSSTASR